MRKLTHYKVSGVLETKPDNLPEGLTVEEIPIRLRDLKLSIHPIHSSTETLYFGGYDYESKPGLMIPGHGIFSEEETRKLRDFLNLVLGDSGHPMRVVKDQDGDVWFELEPNQFTLGEHHSNPRALESAERRKDTDTGYRSKSLDWLMGHNYFGPVQFVENTWE